MSNVFNLAWSINNLTGQVSMRLITGTGVLKMIVKCEPPVASVNRCSGNIPRLGCKRGTNLRRKHESIPSTQTPISIRCWKCVWGNPPSSPIGLACLANVIALSCQWMSVDATEKSEFLSFTDSNGFTDIWALVMASVCNPRNAVWCHAPRLMLPSPHASLWSCPHVPRSPQGSLLSRARRCEILPRDSLWHASRGDEWDAIGEQESWLE